MYELCEVHEEIEIKTVNLFYLFCPKHLFLQTSKFSWAYVEILTMQ